LPSRVLLDAIGSKGGSKMFPTTVDVIYGCHRHRPEERSAMNTEKLLLFLLVAFGLVVLATLLRGLLHVWWPQ
jgi:hypothetical protein